MEQLWNQVRQLRGRPGAVAALATGVAVVWLLLAGLVGALVVSDDDGVDLTAGDDDTSFLDTAEGGGDLDPAAGTSSTTVAGAPVDADGDGVPDPAAPTTTPGQAGQGTDPAAPAPDPAAPPPVAAVAAAEVATASRPVVTAPG